MSFTEAGMYSGLGAGLSQMGANMVQFSLEDARRQQKENLERLHQKWAEEVWDKQTKREDEIREASRLDEIAGFNEAGLPVTRGQIEDGTFAGTLYEGAIDRVDPDRQDGMTAAMKNYDFLLAQGTPKEEAARMAFNGGLSESDYDNGDIEKSLKITQEVLGDDWEPGDMIPAGQLTTINRARANAGLDPLEESSERDATWYLPESLEGTKYNYESRPQRSPLKQSPRTGQAGPSGPQLKPRKSLTTFNTGSN